ncbi:MAG: rhomboid family intramembrane serine protease, partial [Pseudomonadota bacterium]
AIVAPVAKRHNGAMIPIRDDNPQLRTPVVTYAVIGLNVFAWALLQGFGFDPDLSRSVCQLGVIPGDLLGELSQASRYPRLPCPVDGQGNWLTVFTSIFMHGSWMHIIGNMWFMWIFGNNVEDAMGPVRFAVFYLLCGVAAVAAQVISDSGSLVPMVGASGAIGGVMGAYIVLYPRVHVHMLLILGFFVTTIVVPAILMLGYWIVLQFIGVLSGGGGGVAFWAHIGGFVAGAALIFVFKDRAMLDAHPYHGWHQKRHGSTLWRKAPRRRGPWT